MVTIGIPPLPTHSDTRYMHREPTKNRRGHGSAPRPQAYARPVLRRYGDLRTVTLGGSELDVTESGRFRREF